MRLHEKHLKEIIKAIEKYGAVREVKILNSNYIVKPARVPRKTKPSIIREVDVNRANEFEIKFAMGDVKDND